MPHRHAGSGLAFALPGDWSVSDTMLFQANHPVTLRWRLESGDEITRRGHLQKVTNDALAVMLPRDLDDSDSLVRGEQVCAEAGDYQGHRATVIRGSVLSVESRLVRIKIDGGIDTIQRRRFPRVKVGFGFATAALLSPDGVKYFLAHPIDISAGGMRFSHRLQLTENDRFRLTLRLKGDGKVSPIGRVVETWVQKPKENAPADTPTIYVSRAEIVEATPADKQLIARYVLEARRQKQPPLPPRS